MSLHYWGRVCRACDCCTGPNDPAWPRCWFCDANLISASIYEPLIELGRAPSMHQGVTLKELLDDPFMKETA